MPHGFQEGQHGMSGSEEFKAEVNELLDEPYNCGVESKSSLQIIYEDIGLEAIAAKVTHIMPDLKVARTTDASSTDRPKLLISTIPRTLFPWTMS